MQDEMVEVRRERIPSDSDETKKPLMRPPTRKWLLRLALALLFVGASYGAVLLIQPNFRPLSKKTPTPQATQAPTRVNTPTPLPTTAPISTLSKPLIQTTPVQTKVPPQEVEVGLDYPISGGHRALMQVADGVLYAASVHKKVYALRLSDGELLWSFPVAGVVSYAPPYVERGIVYVSTLLFNKDTHKYSDIFYALNARDGRLLWQYEGQESYLAKIDNGIVFLSSNEKTILALRGSDGKELWHYTDEKAPISHLVDIVDGIAYIEPLAENWAFSHGLVAVRIATGEQLWSNREYNKKNGQAYFFHSVSENTIFASDSITGEFMALNAHDGKVRWKQNISERGMMIDGVSNGLVFASSWDSPYHASSGMGGRIGTASAVPDFFTQPLLPSIPYKAAKITLYVLNESDGKLLWQHVLTGDALGMNVQHRLINDVLYTSVSIAPPPDKESPEGGKLFAFDSKTGRLIWEQTLDHQPGSTSIKDQIMYVSAIDGGIYALRLSDGALIWHQPMKGYFWNEQLQVGDLVYVSDGNGMIYALDAQKGSLHWQYQMEIPED